MCSGGCSRCIGVTLYPLVIISIICNILLFFPSWDIKYARLGEITEEVKYMGGLVGGGLMVLIPAVFLSLTSQQGTGNRIEMFLSILFAGAGVAGGLYSFIVAVLGVGNGPLCKYGDTWMTPFKNSNSTYLADSSMWAECIEPKNVVQFNTGLFFILLVASSLQMLLCGIQMVNGFCGCLFGACNKAEQ